MNFKKKSPSEDTVEAAIKRDDYRIRHANQMYALRLVGKTAKWSLIGVGLATIVGAAFKNDDNTEEV
ncbi:MAG TPA: hypothetical protein VLG09_00650 [Candidatus Saccharimonadales bacterium]|nr:hypothetical protein [Candidatus Saccharimonadales bacterium]